MRVTEVLLRHFGAQKGKIPRSRAEWAPKPGPNAKQRKSHARFRSYGPNLFASPNKKISSEIKFKSESCVEDIRNPPRADDVKHTWKVLRGDYVEVIKLGNDYGKRGKVIEVLRRSNSVVVANAGFVKAFIFTPSGATKEVLTEGPIHVSDVMLVCPKTKKRTKVDFKFIDGVTKVRVAKASGAIIPRPDILRVRRTPRQFGERDTSPEHVLSLTYKEPEMVTNARKWLKQELVEHQEKVFAAAEKQFERRGAVAMFEQENAGAEAQADTDQIEMDEIEEEQRERARTIQESRVQRQMELDRLDELELQKRQEMERARFIIPNPENPSTELPETAEQ
ncbi:hypothetical protein NDN08_000411 [Rhodosorus marinus]|uniref:Large ribosomal subunit protein uL24c n=1 Tax=Rhodosorus marinus TaxID=101924 RepID=A0AAV8US29_9RHOD|nr:hypothetical protein NDN08_000411 [Rhodosorus marinus]